MLKANKTKKTSNEIFDATLFLILKIFHKERKKNNNKVFQKIRWFNK